MDDDRNEFKRVVQAYREAVAREVEDALARYLVIACALVLLAVFLGWATFELFGPRPWTVVGLWLGGWITFEVGYRPWGKRRRKS